MDTCLPVVHVLSITAILQSPSEAPVKKIRLITSYTVFFCIRLLPYSHFQITKVLLSHFQTYRTKPWPRESPGWTHTNVRFYAKGEVHYEDDVCAGLYSSRIRGINSMK